MKKIVEEEVIYLTKEGKENLRKEIDNLRSEVAVAKQSNLRGLLSKLDEKLRILEFSKIIENENENLVKVNDYVKLAFDGELYYYQVIDFYENDILDNSIDPITINSPLGKAIIGKPTGDFNYEFAGMLIEGCILGISANLEEIKENKVR